MIKKYFKRIIALLIIISIGESVFSNGKKDLSQIEETESMELEEEPLLEEEPPL